MVGCVLWAGHAGVECWDGVELCWVDPERAAGAPVRVLGCNSSAEGTEVASVLRWCSCGVLVCVTVHMLALVDTGVLSPRCWACVEAAGARVGAHVSRDG